MNDVIGNNSKNWLSFIYVQQINIYIYIYMINIYKI